MNHRTNHFREPTHTLLAIKHAGLEHHFAQERVRIALETATTEDHHQPGKVLSYLGDELKLRGIPAIGRGVQGAITGTRP